MDKKVYYGEYTLRHWIELILEKNIVLPEYQRSFVWGKNLTENFLKKLKAGVFVPPVIIGSFVRNGKHENIIIDGQQRLTTILLGYLGMFPKREMFTSSDDPLYAPIDEEDEEDVVESIEWTFNLLTNIKGDKTKSHILQETRQCGKYEDFDNALILNEEFLDTSYLGFSYIVPVQATEPEQQRFYSTIFHDINLQGVPLQGMESRRSLYYLNSELVRFFEPGLCNLLKISQGGKIRRYDYVRALAFLAEYNKDNRIQVAKRCRTQKGLELYYEEFINAVVLDEDNPRFGKFSTIIGKEHIEERETRLSNYISALEFGNQSFSSIIDADTSLFGLIYQVIFCNKKLDESRSSELKQVINDKIEEFRGEEDHRRSPNQLKYLRTRIMQSIDIYSNFLLPDA